MGTLGQALNGGLHDNHDVRIPGGHRVVEGRGRQRRVTGGEGGNDIRRVVTSLHGEPGGPTQIVAGRLRRGHGTVDEVAQPAISAAVEDGLRRAPGTPWLRCQSHIDPRQVRRCMVQAVVQHHPALDERVPLHRQFPHAVGWRRAGARVIGKQGNRIGFGGREARLPIGSQPGEVLHPARLAQERRWFAREIRSAVPVEQPTLGAPEVHVAIRSWGDGSVDEPGIRS